MLNAPAREVRRVRIFLAARNESEVAKEREIIEKQEEAKREAERRSKPR